MNTYRTKSAITVQIIAILLITIILIALSNTSIGLNVDSLRLLSGLISIYTMLYLVFIKWLWKWKVFKGWFVLVPNLQGTWKGTIVTTSDKSKSSEIEVYLTVRQDLKHIHLTLFTEESSSRSLAATIEIDEKLGSKFLHYNYSNQPKALVRDRSEIHNGAACLRVITNPELRLEGDYWTDRKSTGSMNFSYLKKELLESFPEDT